MAKISTYPIISIPTFNDLLIGTDVENLNDTKNFSLGDIQSLIVTGSYVPYLGANQDVFLGAFNISANSFINTNGTSSDFLKADGSLDSTIYQPAGNYITDLSGEAVASGPGVANVTLNNGAVIGKVLTGLSITGGSISNTDSILEAFGKLQNQVNSLYGGAIYKGTWNADTNNPSLSSGVGTQGWYYIVSVAGTTNLDGITDWNVGDWAIFDGTAWQQVDNTDTVVSVNGEVGVVVLTTTNISEGTNLYYTDSRARGSISLTTMGSSGASTYNNFSGIFNIPNYTLSGLGGVPSTRQLTINGTSYDLSVDRAWSVGTVTSIGTSGPITGGTITGSGTIGITQAGISSDGYLSSTDWNTFNNKQDALVNPVTGTGTPYYIPMWSGTTSLTDSIISYLLNTVSFNYNSVTGATVNYINTGATTYTYTIQMNNTGSPRQTYHSYTDGNILQQINNNVVSKNLQSGQLILPFYTSTSSFSGTVVGYLAFDSVGNIITTSGLSGSGTTNYVPKWTTSTVLGDSLIYDNGTNVLIAKTSDNNFGKLQVNGGAYFTGNVFIETAANPTQFMLRGTNAEFWFDSAYGGGTGRMFINRAGLGNQSTLMFTTAANVVKNSAWDSSGNPWSMGLTNNNGDDVFKFGYGDIYGPSSWVWSANTSRVLTFVNTPYVGAYYVYHQGNLTISTLGGVPTTRTLTINGTTYDLSANRSWSVGTVTSVGLSMPTAFTVSNSPITGAGTINVTGAGTASQYIRGDGQLATLPSNAGGGSSVNYYLNGSIPSSVVGYQQMDNTAIIGGGTDFTLSGNGLIAQFLTDVGNPNRIQIPGGAWNFEMYFNSSSNGGAEGFYIELHKYDGSVFTLIASSIGTPESISNGTSTDLYLTSLAVPTTTLLTTDRLAIRVYIVNNAGARTITLHTENNTLCEIITTFAGGVSSLNGLTANTQYLAVGTSGTDFNINSLVDTHTFNLPTASAINRGALSTADWSTFNSKVGGTGVNGQVAYWSGTNTQTGSNNLFWDNANGRLGIGTNAPRVSLDIRNGALHVTPSTTDAFASGLVILQSTGVNAGAAIYIKDNTNTNFLGGFSIDGTNNIRFANYVSNAPLVFYTNSSGTGADRMRIFANGNVLIQSGGTFTDGGQRLQVNGTTRLNGNVTLPSGTQLISYNTADEITNYESVNQYWSGNVYNISFNKGGTGSFRDMQIGYQGQGVIIRNSGTSNSGRISANFTVNSGGIFGVIGTTNGTGAGFQFGSGILHTISSGTTGSTSALWISPNITSLGSGFNALLDVGTNSSASGAGTHTRYFSILTNGQTNLTGNITAASAIARGALVSSTLVAAANNDVLVGLDVNPTFTNGAFTGVSNWAARIQGKQLVTYNNNTYDQGFYIQNTNTGTTAITGMLLRNSSGADVAAFSYYPSNYITTSQQNTAVFASVDNQKLGFQACAAGGVNTAQNIWFSNKGGQFNATLFSTGNLLIQNAGTHTDAGYRLDVNGTARVQSDMVVTGLTTLQFPTAKTTGVNSAGLVIYTNDATNQQALVIAYNGNATAANRRINIQTSESGIGNNGILSLQGNGGTTTIGATSTLTTTSKFTVFGTTAKTSATESTIAFFGSSDASPFGLNINVVGDATNANRQIKLQTSEFNIANGGTIVMQPSTGSVTIGATSPNASAKVQIDSTTQGFLPPRMTNAQRVAIVTPAVGLVVYCTDSVEGLYVYTSLGWKSLTMV